MKFTIGEREVRSVDCGTIIGRGKCVGDWAIFHFLLRVDFQPSASSNRVVSCRAVAWCRLASHNWQRADSSVRHRNRTPLVLLTTCIVITRRAIASAEGRAVLNSDSYVINRNWKSLIMFGCSESNKTVYKRARVKETGGRDGRPAFETLGTLRWVRSSLLALNWFHWYLDEVIKPSLGDRIDRYGWFTRIWKLLLFLNSVIVCRTT